MTAHTITSPRGDLGLSGNEPLISQINLMELWAFPENHYAPKPCLKISTFNYFDSEEVIDGSGRIPYKISEAASADLGMIYKFLLNDSP